MKKTPFFESHKEAGARFIPFAGWQMPFSYKSPAQEHLQVRRAGGLFDVSHMGQIRVQGKDSRSFLARLLPADLKSLSEGQAVYSAFCSQTGGLIDDLILYACSKNAYLLCVNASAKDKDLKWMRSQIKNEEVFIQDESAHWALMAVQGPQSFNLCETIFPSVAFRKISRFHFVEGEGSLLFSRTGYTGEEGFEIYAPGSQSLSLWNRFLKEGRAFSVGPIGLGARDTLRLEMAYLLSGQDFDETKSLLQAGLSWLLKSDEDYIGRQALLKQKAKGGYERLKGFILEGSSGVPRTGYSLYNERREAVGAVTSGAKSPSLGKMIGLAYTRSHLTDLYLDIRGSRVKARLVSTPFLKRS